MFVSCKSFLFNFFCCVILTCCLVSSDDIPVMLWNIKGNALHLKPTSAFGPNDDIFAEALKEAHHQESRIIVFAVNRLSLEDFSANDKSLMFNNTLFNIESFLDSQSHSFLTSVKNPLNYIHKSHCGVQEIVVDNKIDETIIESVSSAFQRSCVVILHISDDGIVTNEGELKSVFLPSLGTSYKNVIGIFTGVKSSWGSQNSDRHIFRNLLAVESDDPNLINITDSCALLMYAENASVIVGKESTYKVDLTFPPDTEGSSCNSSVLVMNFKTSGNLSSVTLKFEFNKALGSWSTNGTISVVGDKAIGEEDIDLNTDALSAAVGFSYSCGDIILNAKNFTYYPVKIQMNRFQIQPYEVGRVFSDSFDCVPFFTIPIWMGIFVSLLFIVITNIGVYALFSVHTMDRFDDPKGKTISVSTTAD